MSCTFFRKNKSGSNSNRKSATPMENRNHGMVSLELWKLETYSSPRTYIFGYTYDKQGNYVIVPEQAETVRYIFDLYETGRY